MERMRVVMVVLAFIMAYWDLSGRMQWTEQNLRQQKCLNVYESPKLVLRKRSHLEQIENHLTSSSLSWKKEIPTLGKFTSVFEIPIYLKMPGEKEGGSGGEKERKMGERDKSLGRRAWNAKNNLTISVPAARISKYTLLFSFSHKTEQIQTWGLIFHQGKCSLKSLFF